MSKSKKHFRMLLAANYLGIHIQMADGHWWVECVDIQQTGWNFGEHLKRHGIAFNNKIYHGPLEALACIDEAFRMIDGKGLIETAYTDNWFMGKLKADKSRLDFVEDGEGFLA